MDYIICGISKNNKASVLDYQYECLKKYLKGKFEYILFDNSNNSDEFKRHCAYIGAHHIIVESTLSDKDIKYFILNNIFNLMKFRGIVIILDLNIFLLNTFDFQSMLLGADIVADTNRVDIFTHSNFLMINFNRLKSLLDDINDIKPSLMGEYIKKSKDLGFKSVRTNTYNTNNMPEILNGYNSNECILYEDTFLRYIENMDVSNDTLFEFLCNRLIDWNIKKDDQNKYIISFSLYGDNPRYTYNAVMNALIAQKVYKGWICRFYYDHTVPQNIISALKSLCNTELVQCEQNPKLATFWRFMPAGEIDVTAMISRDCDAWLSFREAFQVKKWLESDKMFHIIRDHCHHTEHIMTGMFGVKRGKLNNIKHLSELYIKNKNNYYGIDQSFSKEVLYPRIIDSAMIHITGGYSQDNFIQFERFPKILEYIPDIDIEKVNDINSFKCTSCQTVHSFFIGIQLFNLHSKTKELLSKYIL
jgi:hypothetical protein